MADEAASAYPAEACGLLVGREAESIVDVVRLAPAGNRAARANRYDVDPLDLLAAVRAARSDGLDVVGVWHSHPNHPAVPSRTDAEEAWQGLSYVILAFDTAGAGALRSWRFAGLAFTEEPVELVPPS